MDHGKDHHGTQNVATQHGKKNYDSADSKQHQAEENQAPRSGFQLGQTATGYGSNKASELSSFGNTKDFEDLEAESRSNSGGHDSEEHTERDLEDDKDHHHTKK
ncbi:hypothetical protein GHT06_018278 [Daphnia sinensis]|uniref:Uncharacterized protein n=1 Tax=Daphnia sinensis TaxID=1820382 RepID=A0AAD5KMB7_9CRUS|nr:hypothetical protein GHT06_018278 [Daphnia sinensis]